MQSKLTFRFVSRQDVPLILSFPRQGSFCDSSPLGQGGSQACQGLIHSRPILALPSL